MAGRRPKTAAEHERNGNPGKRQHAANPEAAPGEPERPTWMRGDAAAEWNRLTAILRAEKRLNLSEAPALEKLCVAHARWMRLIRKCGNPRTPLTVKSLEGGEKPNPVFQMERLASLQCRMLYNDFGLTPGTRGRVKIAAPTETDKDRLRARFFGPQLVKGAGTGA